MSTHATASFSAEQQQFREVVARFLRERQPQERLRALLDSGASHDEDVWQALATELGVTALNVPEVHGGGGFGPVELGIVLEEMGRHHFCGPFLSSTVMAGSALHGTDEATQAEYFPGMADGSTIAALVLDALDTPEALGRRVRAHADATTLDGLAPIVLGAEGATLFLVLAGGDAGGLGLYAVDPGDVRTERLDSLDPLRPLARVQFRATPARRIGTFSPAALTRLWDTLSILLAHELVGAAEALLHSTVEYMELRVQFGRPIASFQALKHRCADLLTEIELAKALTREGARVLTTAEPTTEIASMAKAMAADAAMSAARAAIQLRGGIGFTWENETHLYYRRIKSSEVLFGTPQRHRERLIAHYEAARGESAHAH
ncbi:MAG: acyl-CoA dehydrogenase family protein [Pseudomonadales bacterium]|jgi:alkylation response protein AidB-like acyl-CoA dehydrogenase|nr:acyl-CoA dehydrogenase family protein [Pseudomonadales bacterium]